MENNVTRGSFFGVIRGIPRLRTPFRMPLKGRRVTGFDYLGALHGADKSDIVAACQRVLRAKPKAKR